jgi:hypothetical protein
MLRLAICSFAAAVSALAQGLIVQRTGGALQFSPAVSITVNGKDRVLVLGDKPVSTLPVNKLGNVKLGATLILDKASGVVAQYAPGATPQYLYPNGLSKKEAPQPGEAWKESAITIKKSPQDKTPVTVPTSEFVAFLAGGVKELADLCMDEAALQFIGGPAGVFPAQLELTAAAVASLGANPAMAPVDRRIVEFMRVRQERFDAGMDSAKSLTEGLRFAELSAKAFPDQPGHQQARQQLASSKAWLDKRIAVLQALAAGGQWDAFVLAFREFEKHQGSFPGLAQKHRAALEASLNQHWKSGKERLGRGEFRRAWGELRLAGARQPSNAVLGQDIAVAWAQYSRQTAVDRQNKRRQLSAGELDVIEQTRAIAERYRQQNKLEEAMAKIADAERIDSESLPVLLTKANVLSARAETVKALRTLDSYDMLAVDKEREPGNKLRSELTFQLNDARDSARKKLVEAWTAGRYHETSKLAEQGLLADDSDPAILYYAGLSAMATRNSKAGLEHLRKYLTVSNTLDADVSQRAAVARLISGSPSAPPAPEAEGDVHWFSGRKLPKTALYCPTSLIFGPRIDHIEASNKLIVKFTWEADRLKSIVPTFEKAQQATGEKPIAFSYAEALPHVFAVDSGDTVRKAPADPDALVKEANVLLPNNPFVDTAAIERLTGKQITVGIAGNRFFHPFVWERPYYFMFQYDAQGRVKSAMQITDQAPVRADFEWNDLRLANVKVYQSGGQLIYERTMQYVQDRLVGEEFRMGQKDGKIKYVYNGAVLVSAECEKDESLDNRSREVTFVTAGLRGRAK